MPIRTVHRITLTIGLSVGMLGGMATVSDAHAQRGVNAVSVTAVPARSAYRPGDQVVVAVVFQHEPSFHTWPNEPVVPLEFESLRPIPTTVEVDSVPDGAVVQPIQWPQPDTVIVSYTGTPVPLLSYADTAVAYVRIDLPAGLAVGEVTIELQANYQACDDVLCYPPRSVDLTVVLEIAAAGTAVSLETSDPALFVGFGLEGYETTSSELRPVSMNVFGWSFTLDPNGVVGLIVLLLVAALGGLVLNFTPCVLPVIPIKILGLSQAASDTSRLLLLGFMMTLGVVAFWLVLGAAIAFVSGFGAISSLFQTGWFAPIVGLIVALMAVGMFDVFSVRLPQFIYKIDPSRESVPGSFGFGVMTAVLSTPCTAPFMAGASAWAATQPPATTLATFGSIGAGMAFPYLVLSARPGLVRWVPRTGPASVLVKQVMGILMFAVAAFFLGTSISAWLQQPPDPPSRLYWSLIVALVLGACGWTAYRTWGITASAVKRAVVSAAVLCVAVPTLLLASNLSGHGPIEWTYYTPERFAESVARNDIIVLDFTAEWCLNCKALEHGVLHREEIVALLHEPGVTPMRIDLTGDNPPGKAKLAELEWVGIPLLAVYGPGRGYENPIKYDSYTTQMVHDAVVESRDTESP